MSTIETRIAQNKKNFNSKRHKSISKQKEEYPEMWNLYLMDIRVLRQGYEKTILDIENQFLADKHVSWKLKTELNTSLKIHQNISQYEECLDEFYYKFVKEYSSLKLAQGNSIIDRVNHMLYSTRPEVREKVSRMINVVRGISYKFDHPQLMDRVTQIIEEAKFPSTNKVEEVASTLISMWRNTTEAQKKLSNWEERKLLKGKMNYYRTLKNQEIQKIVRKYDEDLRSVNLERARMIYSTGVLLSEGEVQKELIEKVTGILNYYKGDPEFEAIRANLKLLNQNTASKTTVFDGLEFNSTKEIESYLATVVPARYNELGITFEDLRLKVPVEVVLVLESGEKVTKTETIIV